MLSPCHLLLVIRPVVPGTDWLPDWFYSGKAWMNLTLAKFLLTKIRVEPNEVPSSHFEDNRRASDSASESAGQPGSPVLSAFLILALVSVPLFGGDLRQLADLEVRRLVLLLAALALQILVIEVVHDVPRWIAPAAHVVSYLLAGAFLYVNRRIPALWLIGLGGAANLAAIAANGGQMPASAWAFRSAGLPIQESAEGFANSVVLAHPKLPALGDIFAIPQSWPLSNVFSVGDVCIALGSAVALHRICNSRLAASIGRKRRARKPAQLGKR